jgi:hypothetical protein
VTVSVAGKFSGASAGAAYAGSPFAHRDTPASRQAIRVLMSHPSAGSDFYPIAREIPGPRSCCARRVVTVGLSGATYECDTRCKSCCSDGVFVHNDSRRV